MENRQEAPLNTIPPELLRYILYLVLLKNLNHVSILKNVSKGFFRSISALIEAPRTQIDFMRDAYYFVAHTANELREQQHREAKKTSPRVRHTFPPIEPVVFMDGNKLDYIDVKSKDSEYSKSEDIEKQLLANILRGKPITDKAEIYLTNELFKIITAKLGAKLFNSLGLRNFTVYEEMGREIPLNFIMWYEKMASAQKYFKAAHQCYVGVHQVLRSRRNRKKADEVATPVTELFRQRHAYYREKLLAHACFEIENDTPYSGLSCKLIEDFNLFYHCENPAMVERISPRLRRSAPTTFFAPVPVITDEKRLVLSTDGAERSVTRIEPNTPG